LLQHTKMGETKPKDHNKYQMIIMYTKWPQFIPIVY
jgi:hypothetical protein